MPAYLLCRHNPTNGNRPTLDCLLQALPNMHHWQPVSLCRSLCTYIYSGLCYQVLCTQAYSTFFSYHTNLPLLTSCIFYVGSYAAQHWLYHLRSPCNTISRCLPPTGLWYILGPTTQVYGTPDSSYVGPTQVPFLHGPMVLPPTGTLATTYNLHSTPLQTVSPLDCSELTKFWV